VIEKLHHRPVLTMVFRLTPSLVSLAAVLTSVSATVFTDNAADVAGKTFDYVSSSSASPTLSNFVIGDCWWRVCSCGIHLTYLTSFSAAGLVAANKVCS
jgi:hypothetical protein